MTTSNPASSKAAKKPTSSIAANRSSRRSEKVINAFEEVYLLDPASRIEKIRQQVPANSVGTLAAQMGRSKEYLAEVLSVPRATLNRKERKNDMLSLAESERFIGIEALIGQVELMVKESGNPQGFSAPTWVSAWLDSPIPVLGGQRPADFMDTVEGQKLVSNILAAARTGAYV